MGPRTGLEAVAKRNNPIIATQPAAAYTSYEGHFAKIFLDAIRTFT
jgi:hypothetical protein